MNSGLKIFIAEDEALILAGFRMAIEKMGHILAGQAADGKKALKLIKEIKPDLILMDINLPGMDGLSVIEELNKEQIIPAIIITGYYSGELVKKAGELSIFGYLIKPIDDNQLSATINIAMQRFQDFQIEMKKAENLETALEERKYIEKAKGILMDQFGISEPESMKKLQKKSRDSNKKLAVVAKEIIRAEAILKG